MQAVQSDQLDRAATIVQALLPTLQDQTQRDQAQALLTAIDRARFGGQPLDEAAKALAMTLRELP